MPTASFEKIALPEIPRLLRYACALTGDPDLADDIVQSVMVRAYAKWERVGITTVPQAYLTRMVTNEVLSFRRRRRPATVPFDLAVIDDTHHTTLSTSGDDQAQLRRLLQALPARQRAALVLRYYLDYSDADAAAVLGCAPGTLRSLCSRGIAALRLEVPRSREDLPPHSSHPEKVCK